MAANPALIRMRVGVVRLTDAAPVFVAVEQGAFADTGIDFQLSVEPSWANIADKLSYQALDAAVILPPLALAITLGLRGGASTPMLVPASLNRNGNAITVLREIADSIGTVGSPLEIGQRFVSYVKASRGEKRLKFAVVHVFSSHNFLFRDWFAAAGGDPDVDLEIVVIPPTDMAQALEAGYIAGFCAGAPWGIVATQSGVGRTIIMTSEIWPNHPEKCFAVRADFAERHPDELLNVLRVLALARKYCDVPDHADEIAQLLSRPDRLGVSAQSIRAALPGAVPGQGVDSIIFFAEEAGRPAQTDAIWFLKQMARWGYLARDAEFEKIAYEVYRPDIYAAAS